MRSAITLSTFVTSFILFAFAHVPALGQGAPDSLSIQGLLTDTSGVPLADGPYPVRFRLYKNGTSVWEEIRPVGVKDGIFDVLLGSVTPLDAVAFNVPIALGVKVGADPEISPRTPLAASPFALGLRGLYVVAATDGMNSAPNLIGGAENNYVADGVVGATIGGGGGVSLGNPVPDSVLGHWGTVGGGSGNTASANSATVGGGSGNTANGTSATVGGGTRNTASSSHATVAGGSDNTASANLATVGGGKDNKASGNRATVPGGRGNTAGGYTSFAAGYLAGAKHDGTFVWQDSSGTIGDTLASTASNQFIARASGGFSFLTEPAPDVVQGILATSEALTLKSDNANSIKFASSTDTTWSLGVLAGAGVVLRLSAPGAAGLVMAASKTTGNVGFGTPPTANPLEMASGAHVTTGGAWTDGSSKTLKEDFRPVDATDVLDRVADLPITSWRYKTEPDAVHMGPMAEDFYASFALGADDKHIASLDGNGVALAAIQGLYRLVKEQRALIKGQQTEIERIRGVMAQAGLE
jgi:hypothetical protein